LQFERGKEPKKSLNIGANRIGIIVKRATYKESTISNFDKTFKPHEIIALIKLWDTTEWRKAPEAVKKLGPETLFLETGINEHHLSNTKINVLACQGEVLIFQDEFKKEIAFQVPKWPIYEL
jgi:hypothetical protein